MGAISSSADRSTALGSFLVTALRILNQQDIAQLRYWITQQEGTIASDKYVPASATYPAFYIALGTSFSTLILIDGCTTLQLCAGLVGGYSAPLVGASPSYINTWAAAARDIVLTTLGGMAAPNLALVSVGGHSGGGVVAQLVADRLKSQDLTRRVRWQTFGQPKTGRIAAARAADRTPGVRWMWWLDPIPVVPLTFEDAPFLLAVVGLPTMIQWSQMCHWEGGYQLVPNAVGHPEELPTGSSISPFSSVAAWINARESGSGTNHAIADYEGFMRAEVPFHTTPQSNLRHVAPVETPPAQDRSLRTQAERQVVQSIVNAEHRQNAVPVSIPTQQVFVATRLGRIWVVQFGGVTVAVCATKRGARSIARQMNLAFRRLQATPVVDPVALQTQLTAYLAAASDPTGPFRPVMNTSF
jgi:Lipase (class 3)